MLKSIRALYVGGSVLAITAGIVGVSTVPAVNSELTINEMSQSKIYYYDNKYFNSMEEVTNYYLFKNDIVNSDFYFGSVSDAIYDYTNGFLDATKLFPVDYTKTSNAYTNAYGGYEKTKQDALDTFINETRMVTKYSDYNGGLFNEYDQALDSLRSKTKDYKLVHSKINVNNENIDINPLNLNDQNELKQIAFTEAMAKKQGSPFNFSYYYDDPQNTETLVGLKEMEIMSSLNDIVIGLKDSIFDVFKKNIRYRGDIKANMVGASDYNVSVRGNTNRVALKWRANVNNQIVREISIYDLTPAEVEALSIFENTAPAYGSARIAVYDGNTKCCGVNNVSPKKRLYFSNNLEFDFDLSWTSLNWHHSKHGLWFGPSGYEASIFDNDKPSHSMTFKVSTQPSYLFNDNGQRFDLTQWDSTPQKRAETFAFILDIALEKLLKKNMPNASSKYDINQLNLVLNASKVAMMNVFGTDVKLFQNQLQRILANNDTSRFKTFYSVLDNEEAFETNNGLLKPYRSFNGDLIYTMFEIVKTVITYNERPLYRVDFYKDLTDDQKTSSKTAIIEKFNKMIFLDVNFNNVLNFTYNDLKNIFNPKIALTNISQHVDPNIQINTGDQLPIFKQNKITNKWIEDFLGFEPVALPSIAVEGVNNRITNILPDRNDEYYFNNMLYYSLRNGNIINEEELSNIPLLYGLNGEPELYVSSYLGNSFDSNTALSQAGMTLYPNESSLLRAKQNLNSLKPSKVHLVIGPNGKPLPIGSSPGSDGFYNSFENVLINAGFEFSLKPSEKFIFYEDKLISNDFNLIYTLDINQKTLYFADYTKLTYYLQELLKLEVTVI